jgi:tetratricopeptide (TPR) repeat protein
VYRKLKVYSVLALVALLLSAASGVLAQEAALSEPPPPAETGSEIIYSIEYMKAAQSLQEATVQEDEDRQQQLLREAIRWFTADLEQRSGDVAVTYNNRGVAHARLGEHELAIADYTAAIEISPASADFVKNRGLAYEQSGDLDNALADFRAFLEQIANAPSERRAEERAYFSEKVERISAQSEDRQRITDEF